MYVIKHVRTNGFRDDDNTVDKQYTIFATEWDRRINVVPPKRFSVFAFIRNAHTLKILKTRNVYTGNNIILCKT